MELAKLNVLITADLSTLEKNLDAASKKIKTAADNMTSVGKKLAIGVSLPLAGLGVAAVKSATEMDSLMRGLTAVAGSAEAAGAQFEQLKEVAKLPGLGLEEAVQGSINLQAAGFSADQAKGALMAFGNALATVGKGKADLEGVITALSQIASKGTISAEEINQIAERVPQIREVMKNAFGTANTEELQKMEISATDFVDKITAELGKLPAVTVGPQNAFENLGDTLLQLAVAFGDVLLPVIIPIIDHISSLATWLTNLNPVAQGAIAIFSGLAIAAGPILVALGSMAGALTVLLPLFGTTLPAAIGVILPFLGPAGLIAGGLIALGVIWLKWGDNIKALVAAVVDAVVAWAKGVAEKFEWLTGPLGELAKSFGAMVGAITEFVGNLAKFIFDKVVAVNKAVFEWLVDKLAPVASRIMEILRPVIEFVGNMKDRIVETVKTMVDLIFHHMVERFTAIVDGIKAKIDAVTGFFQHMSDVLVGHSIVTDMVTMIQEQFAAMGTGMVNTTKDAVTDTQTEFGKLSGTLTGIADSEFFGESGVGGLMGSLEKLKKDLPAGVADLVDKVADKWSGITDTLKLPFGQSITQVLTDWKTFAVNFVNVMKQIWDGVKKFIDKLTKFFSSLQYASVYGGNGGYGTGVLGTGSVYGGGPHRSMAPSPTSFNSAPMGAGVSVAGSPATTVMLTQEFHGPTDPAAVSQAAQDGTTRALDRSLGVEALRRSRIKGVGTVER